MYNCPLFIFCFISHFCPKVVFRNHDPLKFSISETLSVFCLHPFPAILNVLSTGSDKAGMWSTHCSPSTMSVTIVDLCTNTTSLRTSKLPCLLQSISNYKFEGASPWKRSTFIFLSFPNFHHICPFCVQASTTPRLFSLY